jgi:hypothetical protein
LPGCKPFGFFGNGVAAKFFWFDAGFGKGVTVIKGIKEDKSDWCFAAFGLTGLWCQSGVGVTARSDMR